MILRYRKSAFLRFLISGLLVSALWLIGSHTAGAQPAPIRGQIISTSINRTTISNTYLGTPHGYSRPNFAYTCTGCFPGAGAYDSAVAVAGITASASVLSALIGNAIQRQPQIVINQGNTGGAYVGPSVERPRVIADQQPASGCTSYMAGQSTTEGPIFITVCR